MTARPCLRWPAPVLKTPAADVDAITDEVRRVWADMVDTMEAMPGYGLAAPQIGYCLSLKSGGVDCDVEPDHSSGVKVVCRKM